MISVLFIAPFPPPVTGVSIASEKILSGLSDQFEFHTVDFSRKDLKLPAFSLQQLAHAIGNIGKILKLRRQCSIAYLTVSQSLFGNLKDLCFILLMRKQNIIIHLHGGGIGKVLYSVHPLVYKLNRIILGKMLHKAIVLSPSLASNYKGILEEERIGIVQNFVEPYLFLDKDSILKKHQSEKKTILYLSNLIPGKGYAELLDAFLMLDKEFSDVYSLEFAGSFNDEESKAEFLTKINSHPNIIYHGIVKGEERIALYKNAHIFCLPSYYPYMEGQPISILEAYASGCLVIATDHGGIADIFKDEKNGLLVEKASADSIHNALVKINAKPDTWIEQIGLNNSSEASEKYTETLYLDNMERIFKSAVS